MLESSHQFPVHIFVLFCFVFKWVLCIFSFVKAPTFLTSPHSQVIILTFKNFTKKIRTRELLPFPFTKSTSLLDPTIMFFPLDTKDEQVQLFWRTVPPLLLYPVNIHPHHPQYWVILIIIQIDLPSQWNKMTLLDLLSHSGSSSFFGLCFITRLLKRFLYLAHTSSYIITELHNQIRVLFSQTLLLFCQQVWSAVLSNIPWIWQFSSYPSVMLVQVIIITGCDIN